MTNLFDDLALVPKALDGIWSNPQRRGGRLCLVDTGFTVAQALAEIIDTDASTKVEEQFDLPAGSVSKALSSLSFQLSARPTLALEEAVDRAIESARLVAKTYPPETGASIEALHAELAALETLLGEKKPDDPTEPIRLNRRYK